MKNKTITHIASGALMLSLALAPAAAFAAGAHGENGNEGRGFFASFAGWLGLGARAAHAQGDSTDTPANLPPSISGISSPTVLSAGAEGTWSISASDPENGSLSYSVDWGDQGFLHSLMALANPFVQTSTFTHAYANPGTYTVKFTVKDDAGLTAASSVTVHVVANTAQAPVISGLSATSTSQTKATITWTTDIRSDSSIFYSTTSPVATSSALTKSNSGRVLNHKVTLTQLTPGTTYYFVVESQTAGGGMATSAESSFTTAAAPSTSPTIASFTGPDTLAVDTAGTWSVSASDPANSDLSYSIDWGDTAPMRILAALAQPAFSQTATFSHTYAAAGTYTITITAKDAAGLTTTATTSVVVTAATASAPVLSSLSALVTDASVTLGWNTDVDADSAVYYSASSPVVISGADTQVVSDASLDTSHSLDVTGLSGGTTYYFLIQSKDANGDSATSSEFSLTTMSM